MRPRITHSLVLAAVLGSLSIWYADTALAETTPRPPAPLLTDCDLSVGQLPGKVILDKKAKAYFKRTDSRTTPMWAQEAIGAPESMHFLNDFEKQNPRLPLKIVPIGISDGNFNLAALPLEKLNEELRNKRTDPLYTQNHSARDPETDTARHSYAVTTLISDSNGFGTGFRSFLSWFSDTIDATKNTTPFSEAQVKPWFVNRSAGYADPMRKDDDKEIMEISENSIVVASAGNSFPWPTAKGLYSAIIVGAVGEMGTMARFSSPGELVDVTAPAENILAYSQVNQLSRLEGTSIAAPLVTGVLSTVASFLPGITITELREMIRRTAIKTVAYLHPLTGDGAGVINQYAMVRVAARLISGWPANRKQIFSDPHYNFQSEINQRKVQIQKLENAQKPLACQNQKEILFRARQNFFLNPEDTDTRNLVSKIYFRNKYHSQKVYYADPIKNTIYPSVKYILRARRFVGEATAGNVTALRELKDVMLLGDHLTALLKVVSAKGHTEVLRFMLEEWHPVSVPFELRQEMYNLAFTARHDLTVRYIATIVTPPHEPFKK